MIHISNNSTPEIIVKFARSQVKRKTEEQLKLNAMLQNVVSLCTGLENLDV